jgi:hypothetical protein
MEATLVERHFERIGARVRFVSRFRRAWNRITRVQLDVRRGREGEWFEIEPPDAIPWDLLVLDVRPQLRHLLLMTRDENGGKHRFLCGHDERHWFVAAIPEATRGVADVPRALAALKPAGVLEAETRAGGPSRDPRRRRSAAFVRQGEWFFVPAPQLGVEPKAILRGERLSRGRGSKPHVADECFRTGGETVYVANDYPGGVDPTTYMHVRAQDRAKGVRRSWWVRQRNADVRGRVRHADNRTIRLACWHRVLMNTEHRAEAMSQVVFLD